MNRVTESPTNAIWRSEGRSYCVLKEVNELDVVPAEYSFAILAHFDLDPFQFIMKIIPEAATKNSDINTNINNTT